MNERPLTPLLDMLEERRVFGIERDDARGVFYIVEHCDTEFGCEFTAEQLVELAGELLALAAYAGSQSE